MGWFVKDPVLLCVFLGKPCDTFYWLSNMVTSFTRASRIKPGASSTQIQFSFKDKATLASSCATRARLLIDNNILGAVHGILLENEKRKWYFSIASVSFRLQYNVWLDKTHIYTNRNTGKLAQSDYTSSSLCGYSYRSLAGLDSFDSCRIARGSSIKTLVAVGIMYLIRNLYGISNLEHEWYWEETMPSA